MILEKHHGSEYLREAIHGQKDITGGNEVLKEDLRPGHFGTKNIQHRLTSPTHSGGVRPHHHRSADCAHGDEKGQYLEKGLHIRIRLPFHF